MEQSYPKIPQFNSEKKEIKRVDYLEESPILKKERRVRPVYIFLFIGLLVVGLIVKNMDLFLVFIISLILGTIAMWLVGRLSPDPPTVFHSFIGVLIIETLAIPFSYMLFLGDLLIMVTAVIVIMKFVGITGFHAFFAVLLYMAIRFVFILFIITAFLD